MASPEELHSSLPEDVSLEVEGFNKQFILAYRAELDRLQQADSDERSNLYDRALKIGIDIIRGDS